MTDLDNPPVQRKVLGLRKQPKSERDPVKDAPIFLKADLSVYMVWTPNGHMPRRLYNSDEKDLALSHAKRLARVSGQRFYVMRSWRGFDPEPE